MAAPMLTTKQKKKAIRNPKNKGQTLKSVWCNPYEVKWPAIDTAIVQQIFETLESSLIRLNLKREKTPGHRKKNKNDGNNIQWTEEQQRARSSLVFGINAVTRSLEQRSLRLVLVDRSATPAMLTAHLLPLCATRKTPALCLPGLAQRTQHLLGLSSLVTIGFKKVEDAIPVIDDLVDHLTRLAPRISLPWLPDTKPDTNDTSDVQHTSNSDVQSQQPTNYDDKDTSQSQDTSQNECSDKIKSETDEVGHLSNDAKSSTAEGSETSKPYQPPPNISYENVPLEFFPYKHLYIFKAASDEPSEPAGFGSGFIGFSKDEDEEDTVHLGTDEQRNAEKHSWRGIKRHNVESTKMNHGGKKRKKEMKHGGKKLKYHSAKMGQTKANPSRKEGKKKKAKKG